MKKTPITIPAAMTAISLVLAGCVNPMPLSVGRPALLPDGHSTLALAAGSVCTTDCWHGVTVAGVVRSHWVNGQYVSEPQDFRPVTTPAPGLDLANMIVPAAIQGGATFGAGVVVAHGIEQAGAWQAQGTAASGKAVGQGIAKGDSAIGSGVAQSGAAIGRGYAAAKPPVITNTNVNTFANTNALSAVSSSKSAAAANASASARATQSQSQLQAQGFFLNQAYVPGTKPLP